MTARVTPAGPLQAEVLAALHQAAFPAPQAWSAAAIAALLSQPGVAALLHAEGGMVLYRLAADEAEILTLAVPADRRRQGIGAALLDAAQAAVVEGGGATMFLEVSETNFAARGLYEVFGYCSAGHRRCYYADGTDALILRVSLARGAATGL